MAGDRRHIHDPEKAADFARALGLMVGGHHPFVGDWQVKGLYAYRYGKYKGQAYFGTGGSESDRLKDTHDPNKPGESNQKYRPWNRDDPKIPEDIRQKLIRIEERMNPTRQPSTNPSPKDMLREDNILVSEHSLSKYNGIYTIQTSEINGKPWYKNNSGCMLYFYNANSGGGPSWSLDDRSQDGTNDWFRGGWIEPPNSGGPPLGTRTWKDAGTIRMESIRNDGGKMALKSVHGKYLSAQPDGRAEWNRTVASDWEFFELGERDGRKITLKSAHGKYVSAQPDGAVQINRDHAPPGGWEEFTVETRPGSTPGDAHDFVHLKSVHGFYLSAQADGTAQWNRDRAPPGGWEDIQFVPYSTQNQEPAPIKRGESIEILEAVAGRPVRFKINNRPSSNDAWVGIYPPNARDQDHGAENNRWKWLQNIDVNNATFPRQAPGPQSIRVFADGGYTLHARKDFNVRPAEPADPSSSKRRAVAAMVVGIALFTMGLPLLIIGSISTAEDRLGMLIPGAVMMSVGGFALLISIAAIIRMGSTEGHSSVAGTRTEGSASTHLEVLSFNHRQPVRFCITNPPEHNDAWVGLYPANAGDQDHGDRWHYLRDIDVNNATLPGQEQGAWSLRLFSDGRYTLDHRVDFELRASSKEEVWMREAEFGDQRLNGLIPDHRNNFTKKVTTSKIVAQQKVGNLTHFETGDTTYLVYDHDLKEKSSEENPFWDVN